MGRSWHAQSARERECHAAPSQLPFSRLSVPFVLLPSHCVQVAHTNAENAALKRSLVTTEQERDAAQNQVRCHLCLATSHVPMQARPSAVRCVWCGRAHTATCC